MDLPTLAPGEGPIRVRWLGTAGFELTCEDHVLLFDPYLTRASLTRCIAGRLRPDEAVIAAHVSRADAIVTGHTHFDHVLDVPLIAKRTGARVFGSRSAAALCRASGVPESQVQVVEREAGSEPAVAEIGPFRLTFLPNAHSPLLLGRVPFPGDIADCDAVPMRAERYRCGAVFAVEVVVAGRKLFHLGSANLLECAFRPGDVDLLLMCVAGWTTTERFPERVISALSPKNILLSHWDDFFSPLARPARALPAMRVPNLHDRLTRASRDTRIGVVPLLGETRL